MFHYPHFLIWVYAFSHLRLRSVVTLDMIFLHFLWDVDRQIDMFFLHLNIGLLCEQGKWRMAKWKQTCGTRVIREQWFATWFCQTYGKLIPRYMYVTDCCARPKPYGFALDQSGLDRFITYHDLQYVLSIIHCLHIQLLLAVSTGSVHRQTASWFYIIYHWSWKTAFCNNKLQQ